MYALNLGCGSRKHDIEGYEKTINVDVRAEVKPDLVSDIFEIEKNAKAAGINLRGNLGMFYSSHTLEHFPAMVVKRILRYMHDLMAPKGKLWIVVPNLEFACVQILKDGTPNGTSMDILYGHQEYDQNFHKVGFTPRSLRKFIEDSALWKVGSCEAISGGFEIELKGEKL